MGKQKDFEWRYQPLDDSDDARMLTYVQNQKLHPTQDKTAMIMQALRSFYMPLALYSAGNVDSARLKLVTMDCLKALANQFNYLCAVLGIDPQKVGGMMSGIAPTFTQAPLQSHDADAEDEEIEDFEPQLWNLAGMTTDRETFD